MALIDHLYDASRVIKRLADTNSDLYREVEELKTSLHTSDLEEEVNHLKAELKECRARVWTLDDELLTLSRDVKATRTTSWAAKETLKEERLGLPKKIKRAIAEYKKSLGFELGLLRSRQVTYEFGYWVAYARFRSKYPDLELELDPFTNLLEDQGVEMPIKIPFDNSPEVPPN
ncbi:hypothetical protein C4D60_Mb04t12320 [Musa balbisiana]|uniref:Uncharacterized protein n=1 Tax=Musa balbisiana TaxID=52838 RepID=A0A4S8KBI4_MUSBA|nr:hypothetical protein C4D60_Mb04t12320 [Musa balbisiana]